MTQQEALSIIVHAAWSALNCEGAARAAAQHLGAYQGHDCSEFDNIRSALLALDSHGFDTEKLYQQADKIKI